MTAFELEIERDLDDPRDHIDYLARCRRRREQAELERADMDYAEEQSERMCIDD